MARSFVGLDLLRLQGVRERVSWVERAYRVYRV